MLKNFVGRVEAAGERGVVSVGEAVPTGFRLDSQRLLSYLTSMRVLTLAVTPANSTTFWNTIYFYTASATAGNHSYDCARGRHRTVSAAASRRHVDAFLDLFTRESPRLERFIREESSQRAPPYFVDGGSIN